MTSTTNIDGETLVELPGLREAVKQAYDLDAFASDTPSEYQRGQVELIAALFFRGDDPGNGERETIIFRLVDEFQSMTSTWTR